MMSLNNSGSIVVSHRSVEESTETTRCEIIHFPDAIPGNNGKFSQQLKRIGWKEYLRPWPPTKMYPDVCSRAKASIPTIVDIPGIACVANM